MGEITDVPSDHGDFTENCEKFYVRPQENYWESPNMAPPPHVEKSDPEFPKKEEAKTQENLQATSSGNPDSKADTGPAQVEKY